MVKKTIRINVNKRWYKIDIENQQLLSSDVFPKLITVRISFLGFSSVKQIHLSVISISFIILVAFYTKQWSNDCWGIPPPPHPHPSFSLSPCNTSQCLVLVFLLIIIFFCSYLLSSFLACNKSKSLSLALSFFSFILIFFLLFSLSFILIFAAHLVLHSCDISVSNWKQTRVIFSFAKFALCLVVCCLFSSFASASSFLVFCFFVSHGWSRIPCLSLIMWI